jgi:hypothetical protein
MNGKLRKSYRVLLLAALVVALTVPLGFALSIPQSPSPSVVEGRTDSIVASARMPTHMSETSSARGAGSRQLLESVEFAAVGSLLMGCASIAKRG